ncbi:hypothetical protein MAR_031145, partial [Mya arenaria]
NNCNNACANNSCDALNGQCDQGCEYGYSGSFCNSSCPANCKSCHQFNGRGCIEEIVADNNGAVMIGAMGGVIALLSVFLALSVGYIVFMKRRHNREHTEKQSASDSKADEEARTYEQLQERTEQPNFQNVKDNGSDNYAVLFADTNI